MPERENQVRENPRISANSLSEYLVANAARRHKIIQEQKRPRAFQVTYYREAEEAIAEFLASGGSSSSVLDRFVRKLQSQGPAKEWELTRRVTCLEAIESFRSILNVISFPGFELRREPANSRALFLAGVSISVRPEILLRREQPGGRELGAIKLFFSKNQDLTESRARYLGSIVHNYLETNYTKDGKAAYRACFVLDVFGRRLLSAPRTYKRRRNDITAACEEISRAWPFA